MKIRTFFAAAFSTLLLAGPAQSICLDMEGPAAGTALPVGFTHWFPTFAIHVVQFQDGLGNWAGMGHDVNVLTSNEAMGTSTQEALVDNCALLFEFGQPAEAMRFRYADRGGSTNFAVNGDFRNIADISTLDGLIVGGHLVTVTFTSGLGYERGIVTIHPGDPIKSVRVGGQEFFVDDVCFRH